MALLQPLLSNISFLFFCLGLAPPTDDNTDLCPAHSSIMANKNLSGLPPPPASPRSHQNGSITCPSPQHTVRPGHQSLGPRHQSATTNWTPASGPALRAIGALGGLVTPLSRSSPDSNSARPGGQSSSTALSSRTRVTASGSKVNGSHCYHLCLI